MSAQPVIITTPRDRPGSPAPARRTPMAGESPPRPRPAPATRDPAAEAVAAPPPAPDPAPAGRLGLCALLAETAHVHPHRVAFVDPADKRAWSGRAPITWTYAAATEIVSRLANGLRTWRLPKGSRIGLSLAGGAESALAYLAIEAAGHCPCLLPPGWSEDDLVAGVQAAGIAAVLCQARAGNAAPAETMRRVALRYFGLRYLAAFGPDVPDGVISLDGMALDGTGGPFAAQAAGGLVSFAGGDPARPVHRSGNALLAAIALHRTRIGIAPGERILSLLPFSDLRAVVTGLGTALTGGAGLETLPVFSALPFAETLARPLPTHLVAPAGLERNLAASRLPDTLRSCSLVHRAPSAFPARALAADGAHPVIDVVAFDEVALLSGTRGRDDVLRTLADPERSPLPDALIAIRAEEDGRLAFRGEACRTALLQRGNSPEKTAEAWSETRFRATVRAGRATALTLG
ncbi:class I adenylate-forming enzyme family protein [Methylobacterium sp. Leaf108]|uniref:AMP-binding protein n=1 Tax=Methylobacterium sp. Leaf108 TaxID=1736256 RepID=UPI001FCCFE22|nr:class I adenylate-forming enzyme family protein [Methylobacterium sp. Leaf108]